MSTVLTPARPASQPLADRARGLLSPLNLHFAGIALLVIVNLYLLLHLAVLWQMLSSNNAAALDQQQIALKTAQIAAEPLRGLDTKLAVATSQADRFYRQRLPHSENEILSELGALTKRQGVRYTRAQYAIAPVLPGSAGELTERRIDASLSGDYRPLVQFINALERDRMFFVIHGVTLTGQQSGMVNLRLRLTTYLSNSMLDQAAGDAGPPPPPPSDNPPAAGAPQP